MTISIATDTTKFPNKTIVTFTLTDNITTSTTWTPPVGVTEVEYLVVAGGGGGGTATWGGGGGAGGLLTNYGGTKLPVSWEITVTVGSGGATNTNGSNSVFGSVTAIGGGHGANAVWNAVTLAAAVGGSGGGGIQQFYGYAGGAAGTSGQGYAGGSGAALSEANYKGAGGGGAGAIGTNANNTGNVPGQGGNGIQSSITGTATYYAGGGGGAILTKSGVTDPNASGRGLGGLGGGGIGYKSSESLSFTAIPGSQGTDGLGGGGGGYYRGGSGIVIIVYNYDNYKYRKSHTIISNTTTLTNYQVSLTVNYGSGIDSAGVVYLNSKCNVDFSDIRFTNAAGTPLSYWIESKTDSSTATVWVKVDSIATTPGSTIYIYYGNTSATSESSGDNTFIFFDNFEGTSLNTTTKWTLTDGTIPSVASNIVTSTVYCQVTSKTSFTTDTIVEYQLKCVAGTTRYRFAGSISLDIDCGVFDNSNQIYWNGWTGTHASVGWNTVSEIWNTATSTYTWNIRTYTYSRTYITSTKPVFFRNGDSAGSFVGNLQIKALKARAYTATPPTQSIWGTEESLGTYKVTITPTTGTDPLSVAYNVIVPTIEAPLNDFGLYYGDGDWYLSNNVVTFSTTHTYDEPGTYTVYADGYTSTVQPTWDIILVPSNIHPINEIQSTVESWLDTYTNESGRFTFTFLEAEEDVNWESIYYGPSFGTGPWPLSVFQVTVFRNESPFNFLAGGGSIYQHAAVSYNGTESAQIMGLRILHEMLHCIPLDADGMVTTQAVAFGAYLTEIGSAYAVTFNANPSAYQHDPNVQQIFYGWLMDSFEENRVHKYYEIPYGVTVYAQAVDANFTWEVI